MHRLRHDHAAPYRALPIHNRRESSTDDGIDGGYHRRDGLGDLGQLRQRNRDCNPTPQRRGDREGCWRALNQEGFREYPHCLQVRIQSVQLALHRIQRKMAGASFVPGFHRLCQSIQVPI